MSNTQQQAGASGGIGFSGLLTIVFITLKLLKVIDWSWWWVLSPLWIPFLAVVFIFCLMGLFLVLPIGRGR